MQTTQYPQFQNEAVQMTEAFLSGENFTSRLAEKVFATFVSVQSLSTGDDLTYTARLRLAKELLLQHQPMKIGADIMHVPMIESGAVPYLTKVALVRYINLCHKGKYIIVLGKDVLFQPEHLGHVPKHNLELFIKLNVTEANKTTSNAFINRIRSWVQGFRFMALSTI